MTRGRSFLLLEVVVGLALLAALGVALLQIQTRAVRQAKQAQRLATIHQQVEQLLWTWTEQRVSVTLPASGHFDERTFWRRTAMPQRVSFGVITTQISVIVTEQDTAGEIQEVYRVDWLVAPRPGARS